MGPGEEPPERPNPVRAFFITHIKTLVTLLMIFGTIIVIVVIVMAHNIKWHSQELEREEACRDVAVVGAGISGTYTAWRVRNSGLKVSLFEASDRIGGRVHTRHLAGLGADINAELGALYYLPQRHLLLNQTIHALGLGPRQLYQQSHVQPTSLGFLLRGVHLRENELTSDKLPYNLSPGERNLSPDQLLRMYLNKAVSNESDLASNPLRATTKDGRHLYKHGLWNVLGRVGSKEGYSYLYDTTEWRSFLSNENAAVLGSLPMQEKDLPMTLKEGMDEVPKKMARQFLNASFNHDVRTNWRLTCINKREFKQGYNLIFTKTVTHGEFTKDLWTKEEVCAKSVVLAMPPAAINRLTWQSLEKWQLQDDMASVEPVPALRVLFAFDRKLDRRHRRNVHHVTTDLPIRQVMYLGGRGPGRSAVAKLIGPRNFHRKRRGEKKIIEALARQASEQHLYMVANVDGADTQYFADMLTKVKHDTSCNKSDEIVKHITRQLAQAYNIPERQVPTPQAVLVKDWAKTSGGCGWHIWKKGVLVDDVMNRMIKPVHRENVFVVGSTFCGGECQLWMEGALKTVELLLELYFNIR